MSDAGRLAASAVVLAGGRSSRMGRPKALLPFAGQILILRVLERLSGVTDERVVVAAPDQALPELPALLVRDPVPHLGPVAGLAVGLEAARAARAFVTSCDVPFLSPSLVRWLLEQSPSWDVVVPEWEGRLQPLTAVYSTALAPACRRLLEEGKRRPVDLYPGARVRVVKEDEIRRRDPEGRSFLNMNAPEEYERALALAAREGA